MSILSQDPKIQKRREYRCADWHATKRSETRIEARNSGTGATLSFTCAYGRVFSVTGSTGTEYPIYGGACGCPDYQHRAMDEARNCRHTAALCCVEDLIAREREARERDLRTPNKLRNRLESLNARIEVARELAAHMAAEGVEELAVAA